MQCAIAAADAEISAPPAWPEPARQDLPDEASLLRRAEALRAAGDWQQAAGILRVALREAPLSPPLWTGLAACLLSGGAFLPALTAADAALDLAPASAKAWLIRGTALAARNQPELALAALCRAHALTPDCPHATLNLGNALLSLDRIDEAEPLVRRALALAPDLAEAHASLGYLETCRHDLVRARTCHERAIALRPDLAQARGNLATTLLLGGDDPAGFRAYEWRKSDPRHAFACWASPRPEWTGQDLRGRTLLVFCEQGAGDTIMCARYLPLLAQRGARIVLVCAAPLAPLLRGLPGVCAIVERAPPHANALVAQGESVPDYDFWINQLSLPLHFPPSDGRMPGAGGYLTADPHRAAALRACLPQGLRVGFARAGNPEHNNDRRRSIPPDRLRPLHALADLHLVRIQPRDATPGLIDPPIALTDYAHTAALIDSLDLVIAVDTSVAHLAGALGKECWLLLPFLPDWRWGLRDQRSRWYDSLRLFRQPAPGDWSTVITGVAASLGALPPPSTPKPC